MNSRYVENLQDGFEERSTLMAKKFREQFEGMGPGMRNTRGPQETVAWFNLMLQWYGPDYSRALKLVDPAEYRKVLEAQAWMRGQLALRRQQEMAQYRTQMPNYRLDEMQGVNRGATV